jgi:predicted PurR-regulated permease PerM
MLRDEQRYSKGLVFKRTWYQSLNVHPVLVFLAVIVGGGLSGLLGVLFAIPKLAVLRVLFDFFRARVRTGE